MSIAFDSSSALFEDTLLLSERFTPLRADVCLHALWSVIVLSIATRTAGLWRRRVEVGVHSRLSLGVSILATAGSLAGCLTSQIVVSGMARTRLVLLIFPLALYSFFLPSGQDARHLGRYGPEGQ